MSDDNDEVDFDEDVGFEGDAGFDDFNTSGTVGDLWRNNPMVKIGAIMAVFALIVGAVILFGGGKKSDPSSRLRSAPVAQDTGGQEDVVTEKYREAIEQRNEEAVETAMKNQTSALPLTPDPARRLLAPEIEDDEEEDPLERWRKLQEQRLRTQPRALDKDNKNQKAGGDAEVDTRAQAVTAIAKSMAAQMEGVLGAREIPELMIETITPVKYLEDMLAEEEKRLEAQREAQAEGGDDDDVEIILLPAGEIEYAQMITEANSDAPGPILAEIMSGPLRGSRVLGSFQMQEDYLVLNFNQIVIDGISYPAQAVAIDPKTANPGVATEVDQRYFTRVVLPAAAAFVQGMASAVAQSESTTVNIEGSTTTSTEEDLDVNQEVATGIEEFGREAGDAIDEIAQKTKPLIRVAAGTPLGILFVQPVVQD